GGSSLSSIIGAFWKRARPKSGTWPLYDTLCMDCFIETRPAEEHTPTRQIDCHTGETYATSSLAPASLCPPVGGDRLSPQDDCSHARSAHYRPHGRTAHQTLTQLLPGRTRNAKPAPVAAGGPRAGGPTLLTNAPGERCV